MNKHIKVIVSIIAILGLLSMHFNVAAVTESSDILFEYDFSQLPDGTVYDPSELSTIHQQLSFHNDGSPTNPSFQVNNGALSMNSSKSRMQYTNDQLYISLSDTIYAGSIAIHFELLAEEVPQFAISTTRKFISIGGARINFENSASTINRWTTKSYTAINGNSYDAVKLTTQPSDDGNSEYMSITIVASRASTDVPWGIVVYDVLDNSTPKTINLPIEKAVDPIESIYLGIYRDRNSHEKYSGSVPFSVRRVKISKCNDSGAAIGGLMSSTPYNASLKINSDTRTVTYTGCIYTRANDTYGKVIIPIYDSSGTLVDIKFIEPNAPVLNLQNESFTIAGDEEATTAKLLIWDNYDEITPLATSIST